MTATVSPEIFSRFLTIKKNASRLAIPKLQQKTHINPEWCHEPGIHTCLIGAQRGGKTLAMYKIMMDHLEEGRDVYFFSDQSFEVLNFFQLEKFKQRIVIHSPVDVEVDPEGKIFDEATRKLIQQSIYLHPPIDPDRAITILKWKKTSKNNSDGTRIHGRLHIILDTGIIRFEKEGDRVKCLHTFLKCLIHLGKRDCVIAVDEAAWIFPTTMSGLFKGHISESASISELTGKLAKYGVTLLLTTQSLKGMSLNAFRNVFQYIIFRNIDRSTADHIERVSDGRLPYIWQWARKLPDPKKHGYASSIFVNLNKGEAGIVLFDKDFRWETTVFRKKENGVLVPGIDAVTIREKSTVVVGGKKRARDLMLGIFIELLKNENYSITELHQILRDRGVNISKRMLYKIVESAEEYLKATKDILLVEPSSKTGSPTQPPQQSEQPSEELEEQETDDSTDFVSATNEINED